jgi:putative intracellular protease/amidase
MFDETALTAALSRPRPWPPCHVTFLFLPPGLESDGVLVSLLKQGSDVGIGNDRDMALMLSLSPHPGAVYLRLLGTPRGPCIVTDDQDAVKIYMDASTAAAKRVVERGGSIIVARKQADAAAAAAKVCVALDCVWGLLLTLTGHSFH